MFDRPFARRVGRSLAAIGLAIPLLLGCGGDDAPGPAKGKAVLGGAGASPTVRGTMPTEAETRLFAERVEAAILDGGPSDGLLDMEQLIETATADLPLGAADRAAIRTGAAQSVEGANGFLNQVREQIGEGDYRLLRVREVDGQRRVLFRALLGEGGVNYHDFVLEKTSSGTVHATDVYVFLTGEFLSDTMAQIFATIVEQQRRGALGPERNGMPEHVVTMQALAQAVRSGRNAEGMRLYRTLPREVQDQKMIMLLRLGASQEDDGEYRATLARYRELFPDDPAIEFVSIDYYLVRGEYDATLAAIDAIDEAVGGDAYLDLLRAGALGERGEGEQAATLVDRVLEAEPDLQQAYWTGIELAMQAGRFERTLELLKQLDVTFELEWTDLDTLPEFATFVASPQYAEWQAYLRQR